MRRCKKAAKWYRAGRNLPPEPPPEPFCPVDLFLGGNHSSSRGARVFDVFQLRRELAARVSTCSFCFLKSFSASFEP